MDRRGLTQEQKELVERYLPMVKYLALKVASRLPQGAFELEDLIHAGVIGLIEAAKRFDASKGAKFENFAKFRVKGAILDELRKADLLPRGLRKKVKEMEEAYLRLEQALGRPPEEEELAQDLGMELEEFLEELKEASGCRILSLEELLEEGVGAREVLFSDGSSDPIEALGLLELRERLVEALRGLPERQRLVLSLYYYEELTMKEIALVLGVTEGRVSQIHAEALLALRARLRRRDHGED